MTMQPVYDANLLYSEMAALCLVVVALLIECVKTIRNEDSARYRRLLIFNVVFCAFDAIWGVFASHTLWFGSLPYELATYMFHCMSMLAAYVWFRYTASYIGEPYSGSRALRFAAVFFLIVQLALLITNPFHKLLFEFDEQGFYHTNVLRKPEFYLQFAFYVVGMILSIAARNHAKTPLMKQRNMTALIYSGVVILGGIYQMFAPDAPAYSAGFMFASLGIYFRTMIQERETLLKDLQQQREAVYKNAILSDACGYYEVNLSKDRITGDVYNFSDGKAEAVRIDGLGTPMNYTAFINWWRDGMFASDEDGEAFLSIANRENLIHNCEKGELMQEITYLSRSLDGQEHYFRQSFYLAHDNNTGDNIALCVVHDYTESRRKELEHAQALEAAKDAAEAANRAKSVFLFNMSHDIRTPMNAVVGFARMAEKSIDDKARTLECIRKVNDASAHLLSLINKVLDMARIESGKLTINEVEADIVEATRGVIPIAQVAAQDHGVGFEYRIGDVRHRLVRADVLQINEILINILSNAIKYTPEGGKVSYAFDEVDCDAPDRAAFRAIVSDTGIGMSEEFLATIFESFSRAQSATVSGVEGSGLGMSIVKQLVDLMGGSIDIKSRLGLGTTVTIDLNFDICGDAALPEDEADAPFDAEEVAERMKGRRVLLVEDNELNREIAIDILEETGIEVEAAEDGQIAVEKVCARESGYYDFCLMDIQMPVKDGYEATRDIRAAQGGKYAKLPIIAMTANAFEEDRRKAFAAGMNAHIVKPIKLDEFFRTIARFI